MEVQFNFNNDHSAKPIHVKRLVSKLLSQFQPIAVRSSSFILNDVPDDFYVHTNKEMLTTIISSLLTAVIRKSVNSCIRVNIKRYNNIVLFRLSHSNAKVRVTTDVHWHKVNAMAAKLDGCIIEDTIRKTHATITLSFPCLANAA